MLTDNARQLSKQSRSAKTWVQMILDQIVVQGLLVVHTWMWNGEFSQEYLFLAFVTFLLMAVIYRKVGVYRHELVRNDYLACLMQAWGTLIVVLAVFGFLSKTTEDFSRGVILIWSVTGFLGQLLVFFITRTLLFRTMVETIPTVIVGEDELALHIAANLNMNQWIPDQVIGYLGNKQEAKAEWEKLGIPCLGDVSDINEMVQTRGVRRVYLALPMTESQQVRSLALDLVDASLDVIWAPDIFDVSLLNHSIKELAGVPLISLSETPLIGGAALAKTLMDKSVAIIALIIASPIMIITAILVKLTSKGPVLFKQKRHGWDGRVLEIYKFRSMKVHAEAEGEVTQARKQDDRLTLIGGFIRRSSIDELPQLFNVLDGSMSLVGPRPHALAHNEFYKGKIPAYMLRHRIKPGLTGLAQVNGFRGETDTLDKMENRVRFDLAYINNWSLWLDIEILFKTVFVLFGKNAY